MRGLLTVAVAIALTLGGGSTFAAEDEPAATGKFVPAGSMAEARLGHTATLLPDGRVLVIGGEGRDLEAVLALASAEVWDPATEEWRPAGSLAEARAAHTATLLTDGRVLVIGGGGSSGMLASAEVWDPATASFSPAGSLAEARAGHTSTPLPDGRVLVAGGGNFVGGMLASAEVWDPATGAFEPAASLAQAHADHTATPLPDGGVLVVGGVDGSGGGEDYWSRAASAEVWDPVSGAFEPAGSLDEGRFQHTAMLLPDGRVLVVGGTGGHGFVTLAEVWDPATGAFEPAGSLAEARDGHAATLLPDGRVLVVGGESFGALLASAEVWDPATGAFGPAGSLAEARWSPTATALLDGRVLVVGGWDGAFEPLGSAEVWEPSK